MKTKEIIENMRICYKGKCDKCTMVMKSDCIDDLLRVAAEKLWKNEVEINNQKNGIEALKKRIAELKKELVERKAAPERISVEERMPEEGQRCFIDVDGGLWISVFNKGTFGNKDANHWIPIPEPPEPPKKAKTYADIYWERMKTAFPKSNILGRMPAFCRSELFDEDIECDGNGGYCEECWNQPYGKEGDHDGNA